MVNALRGCGNWANFWLPDVPENGCCCLPVHEIQAYARQILPRFKKENT
jgi:hypothetical protein